MKKALWMILILFAPGLLQASGPEEETAASRSIGRKQFAALTAFLSLENADFRFSDSNKNGGIDPGEIQGGNDLPLFPDRRKERYYSLFTKTPIGIEEYAALVFSIDNAAKLAKMLKHDTSIANLTDRNGRPYLVRAVELGDNSFITRIIDMCESVNSNSAAGISPLHAAAVSADREIIELLIAKGAEIDAQDTKGQTPLILATVSGNIDRVQLLVEAGADTDVRDASMRNALNYAYVHEHEKIIQLLENPYTKEVILPVPNDAQDYSLSCESSCSSMVAGYFLGPLKATNEASDWEDYFVRSIPKHADPHKGFRGEIRGVMSTYHDVPGYGYGVYAEPLAREFEKLGLKTEVQYGIDYEGVEANVRKGNPVIVWVSGQGSPVEIENIEGRDVQLVYGEHVWTVVGVKEEDGRRLFLIQDPHGGVREWRSRFIHWDKFVNAEGIGGMRLVVFAPEV